MPKSRPFQFRLSTLLVATGIVAIMAACTRFLSAFFSFGEILGTFLDLLVFVLTTFSVLKIVSRRDLAAISPRAPA
jgi:hypothetical protein